MKSNFLPLNRDEMLERGWERPDFVLVTGDAYVDHPSFGTAVISRVLESMGFNVVILAQPNWKDLDSFREFGKPRYAFLVNGGNMDSMVSNYTAAGKPRTSDAYAPGGKPGLRPDRATIVYSAAIKQVYKKVPLIIGGIEASLRRMAHYDYWSDKVRRSIILDSKADLLIYGMGEHQIMEIGRRFKEGKSVKQMKDIPGTIYRTHDSPSIDGALFLPNFKDIIKDRKEFAISFQKQHLNTDPYTSKILVEPYPGEWVVQNTPSKPLNREELDFVHELPYARTWHPSYKESGGIKAIEEVQFSLIRNRGCFGGCSFCALTFHQGRIVQSRSSESIIREAKEIIKHPDFKGYIHDVGGPTANFTKPACFKQDKRGACPTKQCLAPKPCKKLEVDHSEFLELLRTLRNLPGVKKVFIRSGIRFDYLMLDDDDTFFQELVEYHTSGQLKVAPEHISDRVLKLMGKPGNSVFESFSEKYRMINEELGKKQFLVPYFISSHPGSTLEDAISLAEYLRDTGIRADQVQDFIPTPGTLSTAMYYSGFDPMTMKKVKSELSKHDKALQRALLQYRKPQNHHLVEEALKKCGREDLIGNGSKCLIKPNSQSGGYRKPKLNSEGYQKTTSTKKVDKMNRSSGKSVKKIKSSQKWDEKSKSSKSSDKKFKSKQKLDKKSKKRKTKRS